MGQIPPEKRNAGEKKNGKLRCKFSNGLSDKYYRKIQRSGVSQKWLPVSTYSHEFYSSKEFCEVGFCLI